MASATWKQEECNLILNGMQACQTSLNHCEQNQTAFKLEYTFWKGKNSQFEIGQICGSEILR